MEHSTHGEPARPSRGAADRVLPPLVAIGVSAGGLEVLQELLRALPARPGFAFLIVQHLDADHPSSLAELLARATAMPVLTAAEAMPLAIDHVYVMPSHADLELVSGTLHLVPRTTSQSPHLPIDRCLQSLASECGARAIGVILSGNGRDGALGLQSIKANGGMTFAQTPGTARFPGMPQAAVDSGCADFVLPPAAIAAQLVRLGRHPHLAPMAPADPATDAAAEAALRTILARLLGTSGIDFSLYRETTVRRRIDRRMALRDQADIEAYATLLTQDPGELHDLQQDLLIGVTRFFRDPATFAALQNRLLPELLHDRAADDGLRIWVPGCSTGEEALSIAICVHEHMTATGKVFPVQIYASDVNAEAIATARAGIYAHPAAEHIGSERLARYFTAVPGGYRIVQEIRDLCVFTRHNLLQDPPFSQLDLISCRNVLMYLSGVRQSIVHLFHYALKRGGYLVVGAGESSSFDELFALVDRNHGFYTRRQVASRILALPSHGRGRLPSSAPTERHLAPAVAPMWDGDGLRKRVDRLLLARYSPAAVLVTETLEVLEIRGNAGRWLSLPEGEVRFDLARLVPEAGLFLQIERIVTEALRSGEAVRQEGLLYASGRNMRDVTLEAVPLLAPGPTAVLVLFEAPTAAVATTSERTPAGPADAAATRLLAHLTDELTEAKRRFGALIEEHQSAKVGLAEAAADALSANEELRSLNEELETAKEELQCTNEELVTVNDELQAKNHELGIARDRALAIVAAIHSPLVLIDADLRVLSANAAFHGTFGTSAATSEGQALFELGEGLLDFPEVHRVLHRVRNGGVLPVFEAERGIPGIGPRTLAIGIRAVGNLGMVLLSIDDVTRQRMDEATQRRTEEHLQRAQRIEAIGRLAGGIAHDFNNLLTTIRGYVDLLGIKLAGHDDALEMVRAIGGASDRAKELTRQLLAFGRRQVLQPKVVQLNGIVADFDRLLQRCTGENIRYVVDCAPDLWPVRVDPGEIGRVIMNLALNARDAMPHGGTLTIRTKNVEPAAAPAARGSSNTGKRVLLTVQDTGIGIDEATKAHLFEPFFTTKDASQGSGLGLSTVLGIVHQSGGTIRCESALGVGTSFHVWLPAVVDQPIEPAAPLPRPHQPTRGNEVVLLVEDEAEVRTLGAQALTGCGYTVLVANDGSQALALATAHAVPIHLLATDAVMPMLGGIDLARLLRAARTDLRVVFLSGYTPDERLQTAIDAGAHFLQKPYAMHELTQLVRRVLDEPVRHV